MTKTTENVIGVYGFRPVLAALEDTTLEVSTLHVADDAGGPTVKQILQAARSRGVPVERPTRGRLAYLSGSPRYDNGVLADVVVPTMRSLSDALASRPDLRPSTVLVLDGITTPSNVGMILRTATAAGIEGIVVPRKGVAELNPLVVKASAGTAFRAPILRSSTASDAALALLEAGYTLAGLAADGSSDLFRAELPRPIAFVLGSETTGVSDSLRPYVGTWLRIPMPGPVESLNVACAAAVVCFELVRRT